MKDFSGSSRDQRSVNEFPPHFALILPFLNVLTSFEQNHESVHLLLGHDYEGT